MRTSSGAGLLALLVVALAIYSEAVQYVPNTDFRQPVQDPRFQYTTKYRPLPTRLRFLAVRENVTDKNACGPTAIKCVNGICVGDACSCDVGWGGANCTDELVCGGHGSLNNGTCTCDSGWSGESCKFEACPKDCSGNGLCYHDARMKPRCLCRFGTRGEDCSIPGCPNDCSDHGECIEIAAGDGDETTTLCKCDAGYKGQDCSVKGCPICVHGRCDGTACVCDQGFWKDDCSEKTCPNNCTNNGACHDGICECSPDFARYDCSVPAATCPNNCGGTHGECTADGCKCLPEYGGVDCMQECPNGCSGRGKCDHGVCVCVPGYSSPDCKFRTCKNGCSGNGVCRDGTCFCKDMWAADDCSYHECPNSCSNHGVCNNGTCACDAALDPSALQQQYKNGETRWRLGYTGDDCAKRICPNDCSGRGVCDTKTGQCKCNVGSVGEDCSRDYCDDTCSGNGVCPDKQTGCVCKPGWKGLICSTRYCIDNCNAVQGQGQCVNQTCACSDGFTGYDCSQKKCPTSLPADSELRYTPLPDYLLQDVPDADKDPDPLACTRNGICVKGQCACQPGWKGAACHIRECPATDLGPCSSRGICENGKCLCNDGFGGDDCSKTLIKITNDCPNNCTGHGICRSGVCYCAHGKYFGDDCSKIRIPCPDGCALNGICDPATGLCHCHPGREGADCGKQFCAPSRNCSGHGQCMPTDSMYGECKCEDGFVGPACSDVECDDTCSGNGKCLNNECWCKPGWGGARCSQELCPNNCTFADGFAHGVCEDSGCKCATGWAGPDCSSALVSCPVPNCSKHGQCVFIADTAAPAGARAECRCQDGWSGPGCDVPVCPRGCSEDKRQGRCGQPNVCECEANFYGDQCQLEVCPGACNKHGTCDGKACTCFGGWGGPGCEIKLGCSSLCEQHGVCVGQTCVCEKGWFGADCQQVYCPGNCTGHGTCNQGKCECDPGFSGDGCGKLENEALCMASCEFRCDEDIKKAGIQGKAAIADAKMKCINDCGATSCSSQLATPQAQQANAAVEKLQEAIAAAKAPQQPQLTLTEAEAEQLPNFDREDDSTQRAIWW